MTRFVAFAFVAALLAAPVASAQTHMVSITVSPVHLLMPMAEVTGEFRLAPQVGIAAIVGIGKVSSDSVSVPLYEFGAQARYYVTGDFDSGLHLGGEALFLGASSDQSVQGVEVNVSATGLQLSGFAGYKHTFPFGLVLEGQLGYGAVVVGATATAGEASASDSQSKGAVLLNLGVGFAF